MSGGACLCVPPITAEICDNGEDDDCDGDADCADAACFTHPSCSGCSIEVCDDGLDNNCDNRIDCADSACLFAPNCTATAELCNNEIDDDFDYLIDCLDPDCADNPTCAEQQSNCLTALVVTASGTYVGDTTGNIGQAEGSCGGAPGEAVFKLELAEPSRLIIDSIGSEFDSLLYIRAGTCGLGQELACDDDSGNYQWSAKIDLPLVPAGTYFIFLDGFTVDAQRGPDEGPFVLNLNIIENPPENCVDGIDNDGDVYADCADSDCVNLGDCLNCNDGQPPTAEFGVAACTDSVDNDCDGKIDAVDEDCTASDTMVSETCNGADQNGNGIPDDFNCRCASTADCAAPQICYTRSVQACGIRCDWFVGDVCPFISPGSVCNAVTHQCEF